MIIPMELEYEQGIKDQELNAIKKEFYMHRRKHDENVMEEESPEEVDASQEYFFKREKHEFDGDDNGTVDLNGLLLDGLVVLCQKEGLIDPEVAHTFLQNHSANIDKMFIQLDRQDNLDQFDFNRCKIHIIDHRRLVLMLLQHNPSKYIPLNKPEEPFDWNPDVRHYLKHIYSMDLLHYETILERQAHQYFQHWWAGPMYISPVVDPPVRFSETEQGKKLREEKQNTIRIESQEEERERSKRVNQQRATQSDLMDIAKQIANKIYGAKPMEPLPKLESADDSMSESAGSASKGKKKSKKEKKQKKQKKDKKKSKKKKSEKEKEKEVKQENIQAPPAPAAEPIVKQQDMTSQASKKSKKAKKTK